MANINNSDYVTLAKPKIGGAAFVAPVGTALPNDATTALNEAFKNLGYLSDDGIKNKNSAKIETKNAWGGDSVLTTQKEKEDTFEMEFIESLNPDVLKVVHGEKNVTGTLKDGLAIKSNNADAIPHAYVFEIALKNEGIKRIVIPKGIVSEVSDVEYKEDNYISYKVTITALSDESGTNHEEYIKVNTTATTVGTE